MMNSVIRYLEQIAVEYPEKTALQSEKQTVSFAQYRENAMCIATGIISNGIQFNVPIAIYLPKSINALISFMGVLYSGNFYCPIAYGSPSERNKKILETLSQPYIITDHKHYNFVSEFCENNSRILLLEELLEYKSDKQSIMDRVERIIDTDPIYILFTSGSTGTPKGVVLPHRAIIDYVSWSVEKFGFTDKNILANQAPFHFDASMPDVFTPLFTGCTLILIPEKLFMFPAKLVDFLNENKVNTLIWVPSALMILSNRNVFSKKRLTYLSMVMFCGEVMPNKHLNNWRRANPAVRFINLYGPTEAAYACTYYEIIKSFDDNMSLPIGKACENSRVFLLGENEQIIDAPNVIGEICICGSCLAIGYYNFDNGAFCSNPATPAYQMPMYRTGDIGLFNECQELIYIGRKDSQIKHMGYRIELGEIETAVLSLPPIRNACAMYDDIESQIVLSYEAAAEIDRVYILKQLTSLIPKYMFPERFERYDEIPMNANGKIDRARLKRRMENNYESH